MPNTLANNKGVAVRSTLDTSKEEVVTTVKQLFGADYGFGLFKYKAQTL